MSDGKLDYTRGFLRFFRRKKMRKKCKTPSAKWIDSSVLHLAFCIFQRAGFHSQSSRREREDVPLFQKSGSARL